MTAPLNFGELFKNAKGALDAIPDGDYDFKIVAAEHKTASTGSPMIVATFEITSGPHIKRRVKNNFVFKEDNLIGLAIFFRDMEAIGIPGSFFEQSPSIQQIAEAMVNRVGRMTLGTRKWQGRDINEVKNLQSSAAGGPVMPGTVTGPPVNVLSGAPSPVSTSPAVAGPPNPMASQPATPPNPTTPVVGNTPNAQDGPPAPPVPAF